MLTFDLNASDFPIHVGFPIFVENSLAWFNRESLALQRTPGDIDVPLNNAEIRTIDGTPVPSRQELGLTAFQAFEPGLFMAAAGDTLVPVAVNLSNRAFSAVNRSDFEDDALTLAGGGLLRRELWFYMVLTAIVLIAVEWFTYHRRITL
jgi:hypothetical protein